MKTRIIIGILVLIAGLCILYMVADNDTLSKIVMYTILPVAWIIIFWHHKSTGLFIGQKADKIAKYLFIPLCFATICCVVISFMSNVKGHIISHIVFSITFILLFTFLARLFYLKKQEKR